jgi:hypothetical protein
VCLRVVGNKSLLVRYVTGNLHVFRHKFSNIKLLISNFTFLVAEYKCVWTRYSSLFFFQFFCDDINELTMSKAVLNHDGGG